MVHQAVVMVHPVAKVLQAQNQLSETLATVQTVHQMQTNQPVCSNLNVIFIIFFKFKFNFGDFFR